LTREGPRAPFAVSAIAPRRPTAALPEYRQVRQLHDLERGRADEHVLQLAQAARAHDDAAAAVVPGHLHDRLGRLAEHDQELVGAAGLVEQLACSCGLRLALLLQVLARRVAGQPVRVPALELLLHVEHDHLHPLHRLRHPDREGHRAVGVRRAVHGHQK